MNVSPLLCSRRMWFKVFVLIIGHVLHIIISSRTFEQKNQSSLIVSRQVSGSPVFKGEVSRLAHGISDDCVEIYVISSRVED